MLEPRVRHPAPTAMMCVCLALFLVACAESQSPGPTAPPSTEVCQAGGETSLADFEARFSCEIYPLMARSSGGCAGCHASTSDRLLKMGTSASTTFQSLREAGFLDVSRPHSMLDRVGRTDSLQMPLGGPFWTSREISTLSRFTMDLETFVCAQPRDPGRVTLHRLNRSEYNLTLRDLLRDQTSPANTFPADDRGYGFDNIADVLNMSPLLVEKYELAAEEVIDAALGTRPAPPSERFEAEVLGGTTGSPTGTGWNLSSEGEVQVPLELSSHGRYRISVLAYGEQAGDEPAKMAFRLDDVTVATFDVAAVESAPETYRAEVDVLAGASMLAVAFTNDYWAPMGAPGNRDRNLVIDSITLEGPIDTTEPVGTARDLLLCTPEFGQEAACAREIFTAFGLRAWRRPLASPELDRLVNLVLEAQALGESFEEGVKVGLRALLFSPHFLYRVELDADPTSLEPHPLSDYELATRLSYFLWSSTPDDVLLELAAEGRLQDPLELEVQVERMLEDPKSQAFVENFAGQWLYTRNVETAAPEASLFPDFDEPLRQAMMEETYRFFETFLREDRSLLDLFDANYTFVNARLAEHYGIPGTFDETFVRVTLPTDTQAAGSSGHRGGILTHGSFQVATAYPDRTSPVARGKFVLDQLLCQPPAPPPANVDTSLDPSDQPTSQRDEMEQHRADPTCASCHAYMDPIGFSLDNYDAVGAWRTVDDSGFPIDATGELPDGRTFDGPLELSQLLKADPAVSRCMTQQLFIYAHGRGIGSSDTCPIQEVNERFVASDHRLRQLVLELVTHDTFRSRRGEPEEQP